jgi:glycosyltransferase involved in cell wall biosynthesis
MSAAVEPPPDLSVVIPTYGKADTLPLVIKSLEAQSLPRERFEVVVIDDGSPDDTTARLKALAAETPLRFRWFTQENRGVSSTRNRGAREARGNAILFIQDDIVATPDLLRRHLDRHRRHPGIEAAVVGRVTWPPEWRVDRFMHWLDNGGPQFRYHQVKGKSTVTFKHFYTCNVSLKRQALLDNPFDEAIVYGFEDLELALRLERRGFVFHFDEEALGYHHHRRSFADFRRRQFKAGQSLYVAFRNHPELVGKTGITSIPSGKRFRTRVRGAVLPFLRRLGARRMEEKWWRAVLDEELVAGYELAAQWDRGGAPKQSLELQPGSTKSP